MSITFSTTEAVAAVCVAMLVERGRLRYDELVSTYWPGFAKHGKGNITVQMALSHEITEEIAADHNKIREILENERPKWEPGRRNGYHPYTFGWIVDQIIRHADEKHRGIGQFLREEIAEPYEIDYHIGLPMEEEHRVARITVPTMWDRMSEVLHDWRDTPLSRAVNNPSWLQAVAQCTVNNPEYHRLEQAAALGIGNARSLATIFNLVTTQKLLSEEMLNRLQHHYNNDTDVIFDDTIAKGHGFLYLPLHRAGISPGTKP
ncbi:beta-lactamase [Teladorsagia circumcincta]|uniref:Beta-lactamase n=1 Tax=Teladorsagia circumcincta TaxID=45464 RepID=A0A2G9UW17_TELCI|nr:beta-lactamase [Teladorsagia circumcincta]